MRVLFAGTIPHGQLSHVGPRCLCTEAIRPVAQGSTRVLRRDSLPATQTSTHTLWSHTLPRVAYQAFLRRSVQALQEASDVSLSHIVEKNVPRRIWIDSPAKKEELACLVIDAALHANVPLPRLASMVTAPLYPITTVVPRPLLHLQRATLFRLFSAYVEAKRYVDAARLLRDPRWRPSQPKHMLHVLLRQLRARRLSALSVDPCQSTRAALRETCASFVVLQPRGGKLSAAVFVQMLQMLVQHRLYAEIRVWTHTVRPMVTDEITSDMLHRLTAIVTHMAWQQRAPYEAATMLLALPPGWRTRAMYYALLRHFSEAKVTAHDAIPTTSSTLAAQSARLWKELCVHAEGKGPTSKAYLARLYGHAKRGHAGLAWQDLRQWQQCMPLSPSDRALAQLLLLRALVQAGRLSLAWRMAHRRMAEAWKRYGTATFNTLLSGVSSPAQAHASIHTAFLLQCLYDGILRATQRSRRRRESTEFRDAVQRSPRLSHIHTTKLDLDAWQELVVRLIQLGDQYAYHPDVTTWQWLVQAATRWDLRMDSHTLWHMASLAVPSSPPVGAQDTKMRHTLYMSLAAGFQQRCDTNSARRAYALAQQSRRRVPRRTST